ncbi:MAG: hypothetical protein Q7U33_02250 [Methylotenera sp.]|uniref:hypothetical protein n=1 Tax=Methylotenera sp. TaxID=2051956 RepID=UPI00271929FF|nr:hypothetical protein [Methylotenera sp.]MDO9150182.1 hypothetical protein [Methylotenera sp.]
MCDLPGLDLRVLYAVESFPHLTQTYIHTEIEAMRRFGVHVEVWSSKQPLIPYATDIPVHNGTFEKAIESVKPHLVHTHWTHMVKRFRDVVAQAGLPLTVRGHHPYDFSQKVNDELQSDPVVQGVYMYSRYENKLPIKYTKVLPIDACYDPVLYHSDNVKDPKLVVRVAPARTVKELDFFIRVAARCPDHRFVLAAGTTIELTCPDELLEYNKKLGEPVELFIDISYEEVSKLIQKAGIYLYTVKPSEEYSMPISVSEALGAGCYVINRASEGAQLHLAGAGVMYESEDDAVRLIKETLNWEESQWSQEKNKALERAQSLTSSVVLRPMLNDWLNIAEIHSGFVRKDRTTHLLINRAKRLVVVLGAHRSGTSTITRGLKVMGVDLGTNLIPALDHNNEKGFWEDAELNAFNHQMLLAIGSDWDGLAPINLNDVDVLYNKGYFIGAVGLLHRKLENASVFGFKDPRMARLLPFWQRVFAHCQFNISYVLAIRHPLSVVNSLARRDGLSATYSYLLWLGHVITSLSGTNGANRVLVDYDCLMQSPELEIKRIAQGLKFEIDPEQLEEYQYEFIDKNLRHTCYDLNALLIDDMCPQIVREVYAILLDVVYSKTSLTDLELQTNIAKWSEELGRLRTILVLVDEFKQSLAEHEADVARLSQSLAEREADVDRLSQSLELLYSSTSWLITKPLRYIKNAISGAD